MRSAFLMLLILSMFGISSGGEERIYGNSHLSYVVRVYDGDTFYGHIRSWPDIAGDTIGIRIYGIDTPEMRGVSDSIKILAIKAKELTESLVMSGKRVRLKNMRRGKYFRIVAEVWVGKKNVAEELIKAGLAKPYTGKEKKPGW